MSCEICNNPIVHHTIKKDVLEIDLCRKCYGKLKTNVILICSKCGDIKLKKKDCYIMENFKAFQRNPAHLQRLRNRKFTGIIIPECDTCRNKRLGWIV